MFKPMNLALAAVFSSISFFVAQANGLSYNLQAAADAVQEVADSIGHR